jgi:hypothetical protein
MRCCIAVISVVAALLAGCREDARGAERAAAAPMTQVVAARPQVEGLARELQMFPASGSAPDLSKIDLARHVR